jgi:hypothetical protein
MEKDEMVIGEDYNFKHSTDPYKVLVYLGFNLSGNGYWHQFADKETGEVWAEILDSDLKLIEKYVPSIDPELDELLTAYCSSDKRENLNRKPITDNEPVVAESAKVGRNDKCPCGSGKKYKKCCGRK